MTQVNPDNNAQKAAEQKAAEQKAAEQKAAEQRAAAPEQATKGKPTDEPTLSQKAGLKLGSKVHLRAVHGRMIHPFQNELPFVTDKATKCEFDRWCQIQFDAGKLALDD